MTDAEDRRRPVAASLVTLDPAFDPAAASGDRAERDFLQVALDYAHQAMAVYDQDLRIIAWNQAAAAIFDFPDGVLHVGASYADLIRATAERGMYGPGPVDALVAARLDSVFYPSRPSRVRVRSRADGKAYEGRSIRTRDGGLFVIYTDASEHADSQERLQAEKGDLERRVGERTAELERLNAALTKAMAAAEDANLSKTRFLAAASHDLLQPLSAARLYATSLKERVETSAQQDESMMLAMSLDASLEALEDILTTLLDISGLDAGATSPVLAPIRISDVFRQLKVEFEPSAAEKGLAVRFVPCTLSVLSDRRMLVRLLQNLVSNALKYTIDGRVLVGARHAGDRVRIEVWDTGIGIPTESLQAIFVEFERLPGALRTAAGAGLGLSIVQRLSRVLNHAVGVRSTPGRGSVFSVCMPRAACAAAPPEDDIQFALKGRSLEGLTVAAVDNERTILAGVTTLLEGWGCVVTSGVDFDEIIAALDARGLVPDVILADYHLFEGDGIALIGRMRCRLGRRCHAALITADRSPSLRDIAHGNDIRVINKPLKVAALRSMLSQWHFLKKAWPG